MTTSCTLVMSHTRIFVSFIILPESKDENITLPIRSATLPPLPLVTRDRIIGLQLRAVYVEQRVTDLQDSQVTDILEIIELRSRAEYAETRLERSHEVEALHARAETAEQRAETLHISLGAAQIDIIDLLESRRADSLKMPDLRSLDEYAIRKKIIESKTIDLNTKTSKTVDDEDDVSKVQTVIYVKTNETQTVKTRVDKIGQSSQKQGIGFKKIKSCFVCKSTDHLIKDCNFHDKQSQEPKLKTVVNIGPSVDKPVWDNTKRVNHQKISKYPHLRKTFFPSEVLTRTGLITPVKQNEKRAVHIVCTARPISTARPVSTVRPFAPKIVQTGSVKSKPIVLVVRTKTPLYLTYSHCWRRTSNARQQPSQAAALSCLLCCKEKGLQQPLLGLLSAPNVLVSRTIK
ncbi:hypothetical protein Tco_0078761 [Tanacetum coccineum]